MPELLGPGERGKFFEILTKWYFSQTNFNIEKFAKIVGIPANSLGLYIKKERAPSRERARKILEFIKENPIISPKIDEAEYFGGKTPHNQKILSQIAELNNNLNNFLNVLKNFERELTNPENITLSSEDELNIHINRLKLALISINSELLWFKDRSVHYRAVLRKNIDPKDAGYITSLLRAIIKSEDALNDWVLAATYNMEIIKWKK
jgi:hypothetical protein